MWRWWDEWNHPSLLVISVMISITLATLIRFFAIPNFTTNTTVELILFSIILITILFCNGYAFSIVDEGI